MSELLRVLLVIPSGKRRRALEGAVEGLEGVNLERSVETVRELAPALKSLAVEEDERAPVVILDFENPSSLEELRTLKEAPTYRRVVVIALIDAGEPAAIDASYRAHVNVCLSAPDPETLETEVTLAIKFFRDFAQLPPLRL